MCFGNSVYHMHENSASPRIDEHRSSFFGKHVRIANASKPELMITEAPQLPRKGKKKHPNNLEISGFIVIGDEFENVIKFNYTTPQRKQPIPNAKPQFKNNGGGLNRVLFI